MAVQVCHPLVDLCVLRGLLHGLHGHCQGPKADILLVLNCNHGQASVQKNHTHEGEWQGHEASPSGDGSTSRGLQRQCHLVRGGLGTGPIVALLLVLHLLQAEELLALQLVQLALRPPMPSITSP